MHIYCEKKLSLWPETGTGGEKIDSLGLRMQKARGWRFSRGSTPFQPSRQLEPRPYCLQFIDAVGWATSDPPIYISASSLRVGGMQSE